MIQPWDWLSAWEAKLQRPPDAWATGWLGFAVHAHDEALSALRDRPGFSDDARWMAEKALDDEAQLRGLADHRAPAVDRQVACALLADAARFVRPRPVPLRDERRLEWSGVSDAARRRGVALTRQPPSDQTAPQGREAREHRIHLERAAGVLQRFGRLFVGAVGAAAGEALADLVLVQDDGRLLAVEAMSAADLAAWEQKRAMATAFVAQGLGFLFVGAPPPWVATRKGARWWLEIPGGKRVVYERVDLKAIGRPPEGVHFLADPETLADDGAGLRMAELLAPPRA